MAYQLGQYENLCSPSPTRISTPPPPSETFYQDIYGTARKPKSFKQWVETAQLKTKELLEYGSTSPLVWVLVQGKNIPPNAIVAGEERRQPLYIARTFYEVRIAARAGVVFQMDANQTRRVEYVGDQRIRKYNLTIFVQALARLDST